MKTEGIEGWLIETHNWGKTVAFSTRWRARRLRVLEKPRI